MSALTAEELPVRVPGRTLPPDLVHVTCCHDEVGEIALCGTNVASEQWVSRSARTTCVVCADLDTAICRNKSCNNICPLSRGGAS